MHSDASDCFSGLSCTLHLSPKNVKEIIILHFCHRKNIATYSYFPTLMECWRWSLCMMNIFSFKEEKLS